MRILFAAIVVSAGVTTACAADLPVDSSMQHSNYSSTMGQRAGQLVVYDYQPGVVLRPYWEAPWRHRHYFPRTGEMPEVGRDEDLSAPSGRYKPAKTFKRHWSTNSSNFASEYSHIPAPHMEPSQNPGPLK